MSIREEIKALQPETSDFRKFGWVVGAAFLLIGWFLVWRGHEWARYLMYAGGALVVLGTVVPRLLKPVYFGWMSMAVVLGFFMTRVILTLFFFLVLTPVGPVLQAHPPRRTAPQAGPFRVELLDREGVLDP